MPSRNAQQRVASGCRLISLPFRHQLEDGRGRPVCRQVCHRFRQTNDFQKSI
ncbi:hypothetical protein GWL_07870 [Herbaspirillum sp. GW103]|nr:hypothetical protein GWL_07870 [Herbaspirillum sp. GW103]